MESLPFDGLDDLLFDMYKKQVLKHLRTKMTPNMVRTLQRIKEDAASNDEQQCQSESQSQVVLANQHCVVIAMVIAYHPRFQRKGSKGGSALLTESGGTKEDL
ncbi:unnamed protein product [Miscanthus lutarioriparius]|uniref:Uncharacterized protein n=1 Tax=Miscanthus lutarioriparius TaxID=422564 RepID=A0A811QUH9_9POAL|nr:unnamed protein product [Miscanthus lutarioriparius]